MTSEASEASDVMARLEAPRPMMPMNAASGLREKGWTGCDELRRPASGRLCG